MNLKDEKKWYIDAVRSDLILNHGLTSEAADAAMKRYMLKEKVEEFPDIQLHYSISSTTREMRETGCLTVA